MKKTKFANKTVLLTLSLILVLNIAFIGTLFKVDQVMQESSYSALEKAANQISTEVYKITQNDFEHVKTVADLMAMHSDFSFETAQNHFEGHFENSEVYNMAVLFPNDEMVFGNPKYQAFGMSLDFDKELKKLPYLSDVNTISNRNNLKFLYYAVPINKNGHTDAILYHFVDVNALIEKYSMPQSTELRIFIINGTNGNFVMNNQNDELRNMYYDEFYTYRKTKTGKTFEGMKSDMFSGRSGKIAFLPMNSDEWYYSYYLPVGVNDWMLQVVEAESVVLNDARSIRKTLVLLAVMESVSLVVYFLFVLHRVQRESRQNEMQLARTLYMYNVQEILFDAYKHPELISDALKKVAEMLEANYAFLISMEGKFIKKSYFWPSIGVKENDSFYLEETALPVFRNMLLDGKNVLMYPKDIEKLSYADRKNLKEHDVNSVMCVPVRDAEKQLVGVLGVLNMERTWTDADLLECTALNFLMALSNIDSYQMVHEMGTIDALTGLKNRNSYQTALVGYAAVPTSLGCIYIDANGLHELNNDQGHAAGDEMLQLVAKSLILNFGSTNTYRIGGDEFVAFVSGASEGEIQGKLDSFCQLVELYGYHVSTGLAWTKTVDDLNKLISTAERRMYEDKYQYYQGSGILQKTRSVIMPSVFAGTDYAAQTEPKGDA